jgi:hypothetical protein
MAQFLAVRVASNRGEDQDQPDSHSAGKEIGGRSLPRGRGRSAMERGAPIVDDASASEGFASIPAGGVVRHGGGCAFRPGLSRALGIA